MKLTITNRSAWPDWFLRPLAEWIAERAGVRNHEPRLEVARTERRTYYRGTAWIGSGHYRVVYARRSLTGIVPDHRFQWSKQVCILPGVPSLVFLLAHEFYHGRRDRDRTLTHSQEEERCNRFGRETAAAFVEEWWPMMKSRLIAQLRRERARHREAEARRQAAESHRRSPAVRLEERRAKLKVWESKAKRAATAIRKLRRSIAALERRAAVH